MELLFILAISFIVFVIYKIIIKIIKRKYDYKRTLELTFLKVTLPRKNSDLDEKKETVKDFKEAISLMEQLFSSLKSLSSNTIKTKILWEDLISFEYIAHENEIYFYIVVPKKYKFLIEKQVNWFYTDAILEETREINIFKKENLLKQHI